MRKGPERPERTIEDAFDEENASFTRDMFEVLATHGNIAEAVLYSSLYMPNFIEVRGRVFLCMEDEKNRFAYIENAWQESGPEKLSVDSFNWIELMFFLSANGKYSEAAEIRLAERLAESWRARLLYLYPSRSFVVRVIDVEETGGNLGIGFEETSI